MGHQQQEGESEQFYMCAIFALFLSESDSVGGGTYPPYGIFRGAVTRFHPCEERSSNVSLCIA